jgi:transposase
LQDDDWTRLLGWPGYRVWRHEIDEPAKKLKLWVRRKRDSVPVCSGCGRPVETLHETCEREVRDLPVFEFRATVIIELYRVRCPDCGPKMERVEQLPSKAPFAKRFEEAVGQACEAASARAVARQFGLAQSTVRAIDLRYLERWSAGRKKPALRQMGVDEIHLGKKQKFVTG